MRKRIPFFAISIIILLSSCSDESVFVDKEPAAEAVSIVTAGNGVFFESGETFPVSLTFSDYYSKKKAADTTLSLEAVLRNSEGLQLASVVIDSIKSSAERLPDISLPTLQSGVYQMVFVLRENGSVLTEKTITFFSDPGTYKITQISSYPLSFLPGSSGLLKAFLKYPEGRDPYIRWTLDGKVVQEALVSNGGISCSWTAPEKEGVYSVKAELFPFPPKEGKKYSFEAPLNLTGQVYVSKKERIEGTDFAPEEKYYSLFHFRGNLKDYGTRQDKKAYAAGNLESVGKPVLSSVGEVFGYFLDGSSGFRTDQTLLPAGNGALNSFTLRMRFLVSEIPKSRVFFKTSSADGSFELALETDEAGAVTHKIIVPEKIIQGSSGFVPEPLKPVLAEFSFKKGEGVSYVTWVFNGGPPSITRLDFMLDSVAAGGTTLLGGKDGFLGLLDEFGVIDDTPAPSAAVEKKTIYTLLPSSVSAEYTSQGDVRHTEEAFLLGADSKLTSKALELPEGSFVLNLRSSFLKESENGVVSVSAVTANGAEKAVLLSLKREGSSLYLGLAGTDEKRPVLTSRDNFSIIFTRTAEKIGLACFDSTGETMVEETGTKILFSIFNPAKAAEHIKVYEVSLSKE